MGSARRWARQYALRRDRSAFPSRAAGAPSARSRALAQVRPLTTPAWSTNACRGRRAGPRAGPAEVSSSPRPAISVSESLWKAVDGVLRPARAAEFARSRAWLCWTAIVIAQNLEPVSSTCCSSSSWRFEAGHDARLDAPARARGDSEAAAPPRPMAESRRTRARDPAGGQTERSKATQPHVVRHLDRAGGFDSISTAAA
jgi:hypothetical protein